MVFYRIHCFLQFSKLSKNQWNSLIARKTRKFFGYPPVRGGEFRGDFFCENLGFRGDWGDSSACYERRLSPPRYGGGLRGDFWTNFVGSGGTGGSSPPPDSRGGTCGPYQHSILLFQESDS